MGTIPAESRWVQYRQSHAVYNNNTDRVTLGTIQAESR